MLTYHYFSIRVSVRDSDIIKTQLCQTHKLHSNKSTLFFIRLAAITGFTASESSSRDSDGDELNI